MNRLTGFVAGLALVVIGVAALVAFVLQPAGQEMPLFAVLVAAPLLIAIIAAVAAQRRLLWRRFNRLAVALFIVYAIGAGLILFTVFITAQLMFISPHDAALATVIVCYATGITLVFGYFVVSSLTDSIGKLTQAAQAVQQGNLDVRADDRGSDEVAQLARAFNQMTVQLAAGRAKERQLDAARRDWIAWVSHDLRTPLTSIRARAEALADGVVSQPQDVANYLSAIRNDTDALNQLIDDLGELAMIDAGGLKLDRMPYPISDLISDSTEHMQAIASEKGVTLSSTATNDAGLANLSPRHMQRTLSNLIGNAVAHTSAGGRVSVAARREGSCIRIEVRDTGEGIAPEDLPHVFERFYRGEPSRRRSADGNGAGMGLGLVIARELVEAHGGRIGIDSTLGKGTMVWIELIG